jgi:hypothetical protein
MRGPMPAVSTRSLPTESRRALFAWIADFRLRRRSAREERLEVIARLAGERRRALRAGEYVPDVGTRRLW